MLAGVAAFITEFLLFAIVTDTSRCERVEAKMMWVLGGNPDRGLARLIRIERVFLL